jgi:ribonuclease Z
VTFSLTILGSSSALPTSKRFPTAHLLNVNERFFLIDCGEGTQIQLRRQKVGFGKLNHIFISHIHGDHVFGLFGLFSSLQLLGRKSDLHIFGPEQLHNILDFYLDNFGGENKYKIVFHPTGHRRVQKIYENRTMEVLSIPLKHRAPTTGFLFREKKPELNLKKEIIEKYNPSIEEIVRIKSGADLVLKNGKTIPNRELTLPPWKTRSYAYISDTAFSEKIVEHIKDIDILYHEATFEEKDAELARKTFHSTSVEAARLAKAADARVLLLGHFSSRYKTTENILEEARSVFQASYAVEDGDVFNLERERE